MRRPPTTSPPPATLLQRRAALAACALCVLITIASLAGASSVSVAARLITDGALLLAWLAAGAGIGGLFFRRRRGAERQDHDDEQDTDDDKQDDDAATDETRPLRAVSAVALGFGILGLITLLLGLLGWLNRPVAFALIIVGLSLATSRLRHAKFARAWLLERSPWSWLWLAGAPVVGIVLLCALAPPGLLWGDEPHAYDVLEYHLQIPREWHEAARVAPLPHNVFGYFPQGVEIHFLLAMHLRGGPWAGMYLAQLMHAAMALLAAAAVFAAARAAGAPRGPATMAGVATLTVPWVALLAPMAYNEGGLLLHGTLAIGWTMRAVRSNSRRDVVLAGVFAGLACGAKLTAGPLLLLALPVAGFAARLHWNRALLIPVLGLLVFSPWALRTYAWSGGNPVFPEANRLFKSDRFTDVQNQRWRTAHAPAPGQRPVSARLAAFATQVPRDWRFGYLLLPLSLVAAALARNRPHARLLMALVLVQLVFWLGFTHLQGRFFVLAIPTAALLLAQVQRRAFAVIGAAAVVLQALLTIGFVADHPRLRLVRSAGAFGLDQLELLLPPEMQEAIASGAPIELVGDAQAFRYPAPAGRLRYRTVFDIDANLATGAHELVAAWLGTPRRDGAYLFIDPAELRRLSKTYLGVPGGDVPESDPYVVPPGAKEQGGRTPGEG